MFIFIISNVNVIQQLTCPFYKRVPFSSLVELIVLNIGHDAGVLKDQGNT
jgi:hypothetical protein